MVPPTDALPDAVTLAEDDLLALAGWQNFAVASVGIAGALAGLIFVGISLNLATITGLVAAVWEAWVLLIEIRR